MSLIELLTGIAVMATVLLLGVPHLLRLSSGLRVRLAAAELVGALRSARAGAVQRGVNVGVKFRQTELGEYYYSLHRDGDGDGIRTADIESGTDPGLGPARRLAHLGRHVHFGFPPGPPPRDPGDPSKVLDRLEDPVRLNQSDIASFSPLGSSTPGTLYLTDGIRALAAVRLFGLTGKVKVLVYDAGKETWELR